MSRQHLNWSINQSQLALLEYASVQQNCPPGVYVSTSPGLPSVWQGVYFVRRGTYAPSVLRFRVILPPEFPERAPSIVFSSDLFHPLVVPLSTYTFSNASPPRKPQTAGDELRLAPGSLNLGFGFPEWFRKRRDELAADRGNARSGSPDHVGAGQSADDDLGMSEDEYGQDTPSKKPAGKPSGGVGAMGGIPKKLMFMPPPAVDALEYTSTRSYSGIGAVLDYMVQAFEDDEFLDGVGIDDAANPSALHAWAAYRIRVKEAEEAKKLKEKNNNNNNNNGNGSVSGVASGTSTPRGTGTPRGSGTPRGPRAGMLVPSAAGLGSRLGASSPREPRDPSQWDWSGVWQERVRKCVRDSISEARLYKEGAAASGAVGGASGSRDEEDVIEMVRFLDLEKDDINVVKDRLRFAQREAAAAKLDVSAIRDGDGDAKPVASE